MLVISQYSQRLFPLLPAFKTNTSSEKDIADNTTNATTQGKPEAANAGRTEAPDNGHKGARNM
jgi:hypothetical protein